MLEKLNQESNCWVEVDLSAIRYNLEQTKKSIDKETEIMPVLKAEAYGHGLIELARIYQEEGIKAFGVATIEEGVKLRAAGIGGMILVLYETPQGSIRDALKNNLSFSLFDIETAVAISKEAKMLRKVANVHVAVDTGMTWYGLSVDEVIGFVEKIGKNKDIKIEGIYSHCSKNSDDSFSRKQITSFNKIIKELEEKGIPIKYKHIAKSAPVFRLKESHFNMIRPGITLYGIYPAGINEKHIKLKPALSFKTRVFQVRNIPKDVPVGYDGTFVTPRNSKIAILPIGYSNGLSRSLSKKGNVIIRGKKAPIIGNICMNITIVDVTDIPKVSANDIVTIIGVDGNSKITVNNQAEILQTVSYEILTDIRKSTPRRYLK